MKIDLQDLKDLSNADLASAIAVLAQELAFRGEPKKDDTEKVPLPRMTGGQDFVRVIKAVRQSAGLGLVEAKRAVELGLTLELPSKYAAELRENLRRVAAGDPLL